MVVRELSGTLTFDCPGFIAEAVNEDNMQEEARIIAFVVKMDFKLYPEKCCYVLRSAGCRALDSAGKSSREDNWRELR